MDLLPGVVKCISPHRPLIQGESRSRLLSLDVTVATHSTQSPGHLQHHNKQGQTILPSTQHAGGVDSVDSVAWPGVMCVCRASRTSGWVTSPPGSSSSTSGAATSLTSGAWSCAAAGAAATPGWRWPTSGGTRPRTWRASGSRSWSPSAAASCGVCVQGGGQTRHRQRHLRGVPARGRGGGAAQRGRGHRGLAGGAVLYCTVLYCTVQYSVLYCSWSGRPCALSSRRGSWGGGSPARGR